MTTRLLQGGCLCAAVRFEARGAPYRVGVCHCLDCRKASGAVFRTFAIYPVSAVTLSGETSSYSHEGKPRGHFCPRCGVQVFAEDGGDELEIFVGAFDEPNQLEPTYELWTCRRESWLPELPVGCRYTHNREGAPAG